MRYPKAIAGSLVDFFRDGGFMLAGSLSYFFMRLGTIYGPLSAFMIFLLWVFYSSCIFLVGAKFVHNLGEQQKGK